jgi:hypothetical protein
MKRLIGIVLVTAATLAVALILNAGMIAGYPWSDKVFGGR